MTCRMPLGQKIVISSTVPASAMPKCRSRLDMERKLEPAVTSSVCVRRLPSASVVETKTRAPMASALLPVTSSAMRPLSRSVSQLFSPPPLSQTKVGPFSKPSSSPEPVPDPMNIGPALLVPIRSM